MTTEEQESAFEEERQLRAGPITSATKARIAELTKQRKLKGLILPTERTQPNVTQ